MIDYRKLSNILISELSEIIGKAETAINKAEEEILSEPSESKVLQLPKENAKSE